MLKILTVLSFAIGAAMAGGKLSVKDVNTVLDKYRSAEAFRAKVTKTVSQEVIGTETTGTGDFYFSKGKLRLEMGEPENTKLVYDGKVFWMENRLDKKTVEVTKVKSKALKKADSLLAALFDRKDILTDFKMLSSKDDGGKGVYVFAPKFPKKTEVRKLEIALKGSELNRESYEDDRENRVSFEFHDVVREAIDASKFTYQPPKGANVTEM